jgi:hypothetical protein
MNNLPEKLRHFAAMRKQLGGHPVGYEYFQQAADKIESMEHQIAMLEHAIDLSQQSTVSAFQEWIKWYKFKYSQSKE